MVVVDLYKTTKKLRTFFREKLKKPKIKLCDKRVSSVGLSSKWKETSEVKLRGPANTPALYVRVLMLPSLD